ncbi:hypothetical protein CAPTEDRAFT_131055 [Capitella teleta]|uniref:DNA-directed RNA polymerase III subunit n=1 Tax=Capitella teleta TaxID=283909 RepID=R7VJ84_CAPTE|nr:hypothetical protein CAPTEDRAFT_131055 [Capitella teleta]|eukprot:ELU18684.1 hypothetical protein CAPTEDRAFT_131055 [Capitella teleta]
MAGRGRGRGRGLSFNLENLGIGRGESIAGAKLLPPPTFPPLDFHPQPLIPGDEYVVQLKQDFRTAMQESAFFVRPSAKRRDIERYSDKYQIGQTEDLDWDPDWSRLPSELNPKRRRKVRAVVAPKIQMKPAKKIDVKEISAKIKVSSMEASRDAKEDEENEEEEEEKEEEAAPEEEVYEEEELEDDTDYNQTYFDNGENYGADEDDDLEEGPVY